MCMMSMHATYCIRNDDLVYSPQTLSFPSSLNCVPFLRPPIRHNRTAILLRPGDKTLLLCTLAIGALKPDNSIETRHQQSNYLWLFTQNEPMSLKMVPAYAVANMCFGV